MGVAKQPGGDLTEKVDVLVAVDVPQPRPGSVVHAQRVGVELQDRAGIAARKVAVGRSEARAAERIGGTVRIPRSRDCLV